MPRTDQAFPSPYLLVVPESEPADADRGLLSHLEMYGLVGCDVCSAAQLSERLGDARRTVVIVARHEDTSRIEQQLDLLRSRAACVFVEGPISKSLAAQLGLVVEPAEAEPGTICTIVPKRLHERLAGLLDGYVNTSQISLAAIDVFTRSTAESPEPRQLSSFFHTPLLIEQVVAKASNPILAIPDREDHALLVQAGKFLVSSFPFLSLIVRRMGIAGAETPIGKMGGERNGECLDYLLLHAIAETCNAYGSPLVTVEPWPQGVSHVVSIRHDVDRILTEEDWARLRQWQRENGIRASWYFLAGTVGTERMREVAADGHEIAFHYTNLKRKGEAELTKITAAAGADVPVVGATCHGGNFHGQSDLDWLNDASFTYGEILTRCSFFPFKPLVLHDEGRKLDRMNLLVTARHLSVDVSTTPPKADFSYGERTRDARLRCGGHAVIMNHPDINFEAMSAAVASYMTPSAENWTQAEVVAWWRETHVGDARLEIVDAAGTDPKIRFVHGAQREPMLRIWADAKIDGTRVDNLGSDHVVVPAGVDNPALIRQMSRPFRATPSPAAGPRIDAVYPFRVARGERFTIEIHGDKLEGMDRLRLTHGKIHLDIPLTLHDGVLSGTVEIGKAALQGLYIATISGSGTDKAMKRNAIMVLDRNHHDGSYLEFKSYFDDWGYVLDDTGIPMKDMGSQLGFVRHPLVATYYALRYVGMFDDPAFGRAAREGFDRVVAWLRSQCSEGPGGSLLLRHAFPVLALELAEGWISGLTQGRVAEVFIEASRHSEDAAYLGDAERLCRIMAIPVAEGGLLASDRQGNVIIEEFVTEPPHWSLNGIGSAIYSLEHAANFVDMPWADELIERVCRSVDARIDMFDSPDYPGSRVQLAIKYPVMVRLVGEESASGANSAPFTLHGGSMRPWFSKPLDLDLSGGKFVRKSGAFQFDCILDGNRDPLDVSVRPRTTVSLDFEASEDGRVVVSTPHRQEEVVLAESLVKKGREVVEMSFDIADRLPMGVGRVARYNEPYHETNLAWMWQLSRYGVEKRTAFMARRWLFSFLTGKGRLPLVGTSFDRAKLLASRASHEAIAATAGDRKLPQHRAAEATINAIDQILTLSSPEVAFSVSHATPRIIANDEATDVRIFGFGFDGTEEVFLRGGSYDTSTRLEVQARWGDEIAVQLPAALVPGLEGGEITLVVRRPDEQSAYPVVSEHAVDIRVARRSTDPDATM